MPRVAPLLLILGVLWPCAAGAQSGSPEPILLFNGRDLKGWKTESAKARVRDAAIHVDSSRGWVRTDIALADFVLTFEVRMRDAGRAGVFVRGWPAVGGDDIPRGFQLTKAFAQGTSVEARWERWQIECRGVTLRLVVDGVEAYSTKAIKNPQGYVGLWARDGTAEFRNIQLQKLAPPVVADPPGVITSQTPGATIPRVTKEVKPSYTTAAMTLKIQGVVWLNAIVDERGAVADVTVVQSLDPEYGLDASAVAAAKQWRFRPATLDGKPARMAITIELAFTLK